MRGWEGMEEGICGGGITGKDFFRREKQDGSIFGMTHGGIFSYICHRNFNERSDGVEGYNESTDLRTVTGARPEGYEVAVRQPLQVACLVGEHVP